MRSRVGMATLVLAVGVTALCPAARSQVNPFGKVVLDGFVVTPDQKPVNNPVVAAHLIGKKALKAAQVSGHQFHIELDGNSQDDEIEIFCSAFGTLTAVPHLSGRANHPSLTIVHRAPQQIASAVHVTEQLNALRSAEVMVLSCANADNPEWRQVVKPIYATSRELSGLLVGRLDHIEWSGLTDRRVRDRLMAEARNLDRRINDKSFLQLIDK